MFEGLCKVDHLKETGSRKVAHRHRAGTAEGQFCLQNGSAGGRITALSLPDGFYGMRRQNEHKPIAAVKRRTNFIMPLLCPKNIGATVPDQESHDAASCRLTPLQIADLDPNARERLLVAT